MPESITPLYISIVMNRMNRHNRSDAEPDQITSFVRNQLEEEGRTNEQVAQGVTIAHNIINPTSLEDARASERLAIQARQQAFIDQRRQRTSEIITSGGRSQKIRNTKRSLRKKGKNLKKSLKPAKRHTKKSSKRIDKCVISKTKKYRTRSSPPYPANQCPDAKKMGNDGRYYKSVADVNRVYKWARIAK